MSLRVGEVVIDCAEHGAVVDFWQAALDYERQEVNEQYVGAAPPTRSARSAGCRSCSRRCPSRRRSKNRVHLDFRSEDMADEVDRLLGLGATFIAERSLGTLTWTVLADPEGNEFCVS